MFTKKQFISFLIFVSVSQIIGTLILYIIGKSFFIPLLCGSVFAFLISYNKKEA